ncbi:subtilisin family serine protease [Nocardioides luteus]|uniref:Serine protease n=1 Tax=Nocardioides luteus TaxID=1844 RepID=A0ABQ5SW15_9ACTN|nr:S8 family serine peptidase [Nocardioides luteus]MDR7312138.1 subtilisin family serine protease [Nocardioides luteus]GGR56287.1 serine protease [Nocardioides luteus]GLJ68382.1 serine protease [Nocardioides luteus]
MRIRPRYGAAATLVATLATIPLVAASAATGTPPTGQAPGPSSVDPATRSVTLVTGDRVVVRTSTDARGHLSVVPLDAQGLLARGHLDPRLFDVTGLLSQGYGDDDADSLRLLAGRRPGASLDRSARDDVEVHLDALGIDVLDVPKDETTDVWQALTSARSMTGGVERLWLDGVRHATLDTSVDKIGAPSAWQAGFDGTGTTVAILDTGIDATHPDLDELVVDSRDFTGKGDVGDGHGHGTHVASIIAGSGEGSAGARRGVAPGASLAIGKTLSDSGSGTDATVLAGMEWAATEVDADVVNMSLGSPDLAGTDVLERAIDDLTAETGTLFVVSASNDGPGDQTLGSPGTADSALTVAATDDADALAPFSSRGPRLGDFAIKPDVSAPGVGIVAARASGTTMGSPVDDLYTSASGTSMASPHVAGAAAILAQRHPDWSPADLKAALISTVQDTEGSVFGRGAGRIDLARAVGQQVVATPGNLSVFARDDVARPIARTVTYRNDGDDAVTLRLSLDLERWKGSVSGPAPIQLGTTRVTVPAHGIAEVPVSIAPKGARSGVYGATLVATDGTNHVTTLIGAYVEPRAGDLEISALDTAGDPIQGGTVLVYDMSSGQPHYVITDEDGTGHLRLPAGSYNVSTMISSAAGATAATKPVTVGDTSTSVVLDGRAGRPAGATIDNDAATVGRVVEVAQRKQKVSIGYRLTPAGTQEAAVVPVDHREMKLRVYTQFAAATDAGRTELLHAAHVWDDGIPGDPTYRAKKSAMRTVTTTVRAQAGPTAGSVTNGIFFPGEDTAWSLRHDTQLPTDVVQRYDEVRGSRWARGATQSIGGFLPYITFEIGELDRKLTHDEWNLATILPTLVEDGAYRDGDSMVFAFGGVSDLPGRFSLDFTLDGTFALSRGGEEIARSETSLLRVDDLPAGEHPYTLSAEIRRGGGLSTQMRLDWTFESSRARSKAALPLSVVRLQPQGLDARNAADRDTRVPVDVWLEKNPGGDIGKVKSVLVEVSYDGGATWQEAELASAKNGWRASAPAAGTSATGVALRATLETSNGRLVQTVEDAYVLR